MTLDINLPGMDGFEFLQELRRKSDVPVLIVSARDEDEDLVLGLGIGADEFVTKPFSPRVLAARARAMLRRNLKGRQAVPETARFGRFTLDIPGHLLERDGKRVALPPMEFELLKLLVANAGVAMSPERIYKAVWAQEYGDIATVSVHIRRLRKKIESDPLRPEYIQTIRGAGYRFNPAALEGSS